MVDDDTVDTANGMLDPNTEIIEKELYQVLVDTQSISNIILRNSSQMKDTITEYQLSENLLMLSPQKHPFRLQVASDFSFAILAMLQMDVRVKQYLLETNSLQTRLLVMKRLLKDNLKSLYQQVQATDGDGMLQ